MGERKAFWITKLFLTFVIHVEKLSNRYFVEWKFLLSISSLLLSHSLFYTLLSPNGDRGGSRSALFILHSYLFRLLEQLTNLQTRSFHVFSLFLKTHPFTRTSRSLTRDWDLEICVNRQYILDLTIDLYWLKAVDRDSLRDTRTDVITDFISYDKGFK